MCVTRSLEASFFNISVTEAGLTSSLFAKSLVFTISDGSSSKTSNTRFK